MDEILSTQSWSAPPKTLSAPQQALWWIKKGSLRPGPEWEEAHAIVQKMEGVFEFDWVHALLHWIEADMGNADYWYKQAGRKRATASVAAEWDYMANALSGAPATRH
jgi:hypothetical protein